jgi:hypothetical protein
MEWAVEFDVAERWLDVDGTERSRVSVGNVDLRDGRRIFVLENEVTGAGERAALGEDVDVGVYRNDFELELVHILLVLALVSGLDSPLSFALMYTLRTWAL